MTKSKHLEDEQRWSDLMAEAQQGNEVAYKQLLEELLHFIDRYLRSRVGHHHGIDDWVQDILIAIHQGRHSYNPKRPIRPWLFAIIRHKTIDAMRRQSSYQHMLDKHTNNHAHTISTTPGSIDTLTEGSLLKALTPHHREALTLTKIIGLSVAEAANKIGISEVALKVRVHRAIKQLKKLLEAER